MAGGEKQAIEIALDERTMEMLEACTAWRNVSAAELARAAAPGRLPGIGGTNSKALTAWRSRADNQYSGFKGNDF